MQHLITSFRNKPFHFDSINLIQAVEFEDSGKGVLSLDFNEGGYNKNQIEEAIRFIYMSINTRKNFTVEQVLAILSAQNPQAIDLKPYNDSVSLEPTRQVEGIYALVSDELLIFIPVTQKPEDLLRGVLVTNSGDMNYLHTSPQAINYISNWYKAGNSIIDIRKFPIEFNFPNDWK